MALTACLVCADLEHSEPGFIRMMQSEGFAHVASETLHIGRGHQLNSLFIKPMINMKR